MRNDRSLPKDIMKGVTIAFAFCLFNLWAAKFYSGGIVTYILVCLSTAFLVFAIFNAGFTEGQEKVWRELEE